MKKIIIGIAAFFVFAIVALGFRTIKPGEVGVVVRFGKVVSVENSGVSWQLPLVTRIVRIPVNQQKIDGTYSTSTKDMQTTTEFVTTQYVVDVSKAKELYTSFLGNHEASIIMPIIASVVQDGVSELTIEELVSQRVELANKMTDNAKALLSPYGITIVSMQITDHDFSDSYEAAVEAKKVAEQKVLTAMQEQEAAKIQAETNRIMSQSYDQNVKFKLFLEKWNGELPKYMSGDNEMLNFLLPTETPAN
ncbi:prohibitin family protein [Proteiniclasticum sp. BAD-10]|uniref:Prohibitin family protein n=1 Tax=Proteiniclasticum sediminis TaxID=2804028 RepID=A0A941CTA6_9CLOT|nr:prohibitin family protein [Proteiniclasticum sediminis]MBR0576996.1 prohibitin family protein [Proteiniclasticum sediminis]